MDEQDRDDRRGDGPDPGPEPEPAPAPRRGWDEDGKPIVRYIGDGNSYMIGVPMRNLSADEFAALPDVERSAVIRSPLYDFEGFKMARDAYAAGGGGLRVGPAPDVAQTAAAMKTEANAQKAGAGRRK